MTQLSTLDAPATRPATRTLAVTGVGVLAGTGEGLDALRAGLAGGAAPVDVSDLTEDPLPRPDAHALRDFLVRTHLGRKGTSFFDRSTSLALVACKQALEDSSASVDDDAARARTGIILGTTHGSAKSTSEYSRDTFVQPRPYLVNPLIFPNAVMNCAAGQAAIWFGFKGTNATIAGGQLSLLHVLRYARNLLHCGYVDRLLTGAVEEFSAHAAWALAYAQGTEGGTVAVGEGSAVFVVEDAEAVRGSGRRPDAEILAAEVVTCEPSQGAEAFATALRTCLERALDRAGVAAADVALVVSGANGMTRLDASEAAAVAGVLGSGVETLRVKDVTGEAFSASGAFQLAAVLALHRDDPARDGQVAVLPLQAADGGVGVVVVRGWSRERGDHG